MDWTKAKIVLPIATVLAFIVPSTITQQFSLTQYLIPLLAVLMVFSSKNFLFTRPSKHELVLTSYLFAINYILISGLYIILGYFLLPESAYKIGLFIIAITPPAVNIIPYTVLLKGNLKESMFAETISFLSALVIVPLATYILFSSTATTLGIIKVLVYVIVIPILLGQVLRYIEQKKHFSLSWSKYILAVGNALIFFILIASNKQRIIDSFLNGDSAFWIVVGILLFVKFVFVLWIYYIVGKRLAWTETIDVVLFASFKNIGLAVGLITTIFANNPQIISFALSVVAIDSLLFIVQLIFLEWLLTKKCLLFRLIHIG
jgi:predicted Na+-dependent transporter